MLEANVTRLIFMIMSFAVGGGIMIGAQEIYPEVVGKIEDKIEDIWDKNTKPDWEDNNENDVIDGGDEIKLGRGNDVFVVIGQRSETANKDSVLVIKKNAITTSGFTKRDTYFPGPSGMPYESSNLNQQVSNYYNSKMKGHVDEQFVSSPSMSDPEFVFYAGALGESWDSFDKFDFEYFNLANSIDTMPVDGGIKNAFVPTVYDVLHTGDLTTSNYSFAPYMLRSVGSNANEVAVVIDKDAKDAEDVDGNDIKSINVKESYPVRPAMFIDAPGLLSAINAEKAENN
jgi:hypothetical protein